MDLNLGTLEAKLDSCLSELLSLSVEGLLLLSERGRDFVRVGDVTENGMLQFHKLGES